MLLLTDTSISRLVYSAIKSAGNDWTLHSSVRVVWLGELAWEGHWKNNADSVIGSSNSRYDSVNISLYDTVQRDVAHRLKKIPHLAGRSSDECMLTCHTYSSQPHSLTTSLLGHSGSDTSSTRKQSYRTGIEDASCAPSVSFVGFMQSAVPVIYALLTSHPQALATLGASVTSFGSTQRASCYRTAFGNRQVLYRPWCFPYIPPVASSPASLSPAPPASTLRYVEQNTPAESSPPSKSHSYKSDFLSVDVDSRYAMDLQAPLIMKTDNPEMKIIFVVRNPLERVLAHYMDVLKTYPKLVSSSSRMINLNNISIYLVM